MRVDNATAVASGNVENGYSELTLTDKIYVGGSPDNNMMPGSSVSSNFVGCLKEVTYTTARKHNSPNIIELSRLALNKEEGIEIFNGIEFTCDSSTTGVSGPITFLTSESYLRLPDWSNPFAGNIQLRFKTKEKNGLLLYGVGDDNKDHIALELYDGQLYCTIDLGSGRTQDSVNRKLVLNGATWHSLFFNRTGNNIILRLDDTERNITVKGDNKELNLLDLHLGGTNFGTGFNRNRGLKTAPSSEGFIGCISDVRKDGEAIDIQTLVGDEGVSQSPRQIINSGCKEAMKDACTKNPCRNNGECRNKMYGFTCDCVNTSYKGTTCEEAVKRSAYDGTQYMNFNIDFPMQSNGEDLSMRFRTKYTPGLLFATTSNESNDQLRVEITDTGGVKLTIDIGQGPEIVNVGADLDDGEWHALKISRRERIVNLIVDKKKQTKELSGQHKVLAYDMLHLARIVETTPSSRSNHYTRRFDPFIGSIENLLFDGNYLIDDCFFQEQACVFNSSFDHRQNVVAYPISFVESRSFVTLTAQAVNPKQSLDIAFNFRTIVNDGIILFNGGDTSDDFIAVELMNGLLYFFVRTDDDTQTLAHPNKINDNKWHQVQIVKEKGKQYTLIVDGMERPMGDIKNNCPDLNDSLYIGGVESYMYASTIPKDLYSRNGYEGCFGSLLINGQLANLMGENGDATNGEIGRAVRSDDATVLQGCQGPFQTQCPCRNGGICEQRWNGYRCDCSATRYEGKICQQHGPACLFGSDREAKVKGGVIVYQWSQFPSTRTDTLNLMFQTSSKDATLVLVKGRMPFKDFFKLTIEKGCLTLTFNVGAKDVRLQEPTPVADGNLHYVAIKREYMNATLKVDDWPVREIKPGGRQSIGLFMATVPSNARRLVSSWLVNKDAVNTVFNTQSSIEIGGVLSPVYQPDAETKLNLSEYKVMKPFVGKMSRVFFNDVKPFELLHANDDSVFMIGDVERIGFPEASTSQPSVTSQAPTVPSYSSQEMTYATNECDSEVCQEPTPRASTRREEGNNSNGFVNGTGSDNEPITTPLPPIKLALIAGVVSAVVMAVFSLLACIYCYKSKGARRRRAARYVYNIGESEHRHEANAKNKKKMITAASDRGGGGDTISRNGTPPGKDDKEYYV